MTMSIRFAETDDDFKLSFQLRYKIYVEEMGRLKGESNEMRRELRDERDQSARILIACKDQKIVGTMRILWGGDKDFDRHQTKMYNISPFMQSLHCNEICIIERLMVDKSCRGSSVMLRMYKEALQFIIKNKIELMLLASEPHHINHYQRLGAKAFAKIRMYEGIGPVMPMAQAMGDFEYQKKVNSPFSMLSKETDWKHFNKQEQINRIIDAESLKIRSSDPHSSHHHLYSSVFETDTDDVTFSKRAKQLVRRVG